jgi:hypothetical protein
MIGQLETVSGSALFASPASLNAVTDALHP